MLSKAFETLLYSWGSDAPPEAIWAANDFLDYLKQTHPVLQPYNFVEDDQDGNNSQIIEQLKNLGL